MQQLSDHGGASALPSNIIRFPSKPPKGKAEKLAEQIAGTSQTPALALAVALFQALEEEARTRVLRSISGSSRVERQARAIIETACCCTVGEQQDVFSALARLEQGEA